MYYWFVNKWLNCNKRDAKMFFFSFQIDIFPFHFQVVVCHICRALKSLRVKNYLAESINHQIKNSSLWALLNDRHVSVCVCWSQMLNPSDLTSNRDGYHNQFCMCTNLISVCCCFFRFCNVKWRCNRFIIVRFDFAVQIKFVNLIKMSADFHILAWNGVTVNTKYNVLGLHFVFLILKKNL